MSDFVFSRRAWGGAMLFALTATTSASAAHFGMTSQEVRPLDGLSVGTMTVDGITATLQASVGVFAIELGPPGRDGLPRVRSFGIDSGSGDPFAIELGEGLSVTFDSPVGFESFQVLTGSPSLTVDFAVGATENGSFTLEGDGGRGDLRIETFVPAVPLGASESFSLAFTGGIGELIFSNFVVDAAATQVGDYNASGQVEQGDLDLVLQNWGVDTDAAGVPSGWINDLPGGQIEQTELDGVLQNWGGTGAPDFASNNVPEPAGIAWLAVCVALMRQRTA